ncbi:MAG TPA: polysaccharide deacetylase family protein [Rhodocyclaceae bacterium]|nr:polysaccharide deacetylase family protein [Rhodocyclaceae bacterium]
MIHHIADRIPAHLPDSHPPVLLVVVDTEEEFDWNKPFDRNSVATTSIAAQPLAHQRVFDAFGVVPTYVVDWPVASTQSSVEVLRALQDEGKCEIGTHLHPWVTPPHSEVVNTFNSYAGNLPPELEFDKLARITQEITTNFGRAPRMFKAGRYGLGPGTAAAIEKLGYEIDASVVPYTSFRGDGGPDFSSSTPDPFWFAVNGRRMLELPVTTGFAGALKGLGPGLFPQLSSSFARKLRLPGIASRSGMLERIRLTPEGCSADDMVRLLDAMADSGCRVFTLTYHSPSLQIGHTPYVRDQAGLDGFLASIERVCRHFSERLGGTFLSASALQARLLA